MPLQRLRDEPPAAEATPASTHVAPLRSQGEFYMVGVTPVTTDPSLDEECTICMETLTTDVVKMTACNHHFHTVCILAWFESSAPRSGKKKGNCPNCRHEFYEPDPAPAPRVLPQPHPNLAALEHMMMHGPRPPRFHAGGIRNSLDVMDERHRRRLQTVVGTNQDGEHTTDEDGHVEDGITTRRHIRRPGRSLNSNHFTFEDPVSPITGRAPVEVVARDTAVLERPESYYTNLFREMGLRERVSRGSSSIRDANSTREQAPAPSPPSALEVRQIFEQHLQRSGLSAEQVIQGWRRQASLPNDPIAAVQEVPIQRGLTIRPNFRLLREDRPPVDVGDADAGDADAGEAVVPSDPHVAPLRIGRRRDGSVAHEALG
jgi:hypothetical protein